MRELFGIDINIARVIITQVVVTILFFVMWLFVLDESFNEAVPIAAFVISYLVAITGAHYLQCFYESWLARSPYLKTKFASWSFYLAYSRRGFDLFWKAALSAWAWPLIIIVLLFSF